MRGTSDIHVDVMSFLGACVPVRICFPGQPPMSVTSVDKLWHDETGSAYSVQADLAGSHHMVMLMREPTGRWDGFDAKDGGGSLDVESA